MRKPVSSSIHPMNGDNTVVVGKVETQYRKMLATRRQAVGLKCGKVFPPLLELFVKIHNYRARLGSPVLH